MERPVLPGVNNWLRSSTEYGNFNAFPLRMFSSMISRSPVFSSCFGLNQFVLFLPEKAVVHNFIDTLNKASSSVVQVKQSAPRAAEKTTKPQFSKELYFQQRAKSARSKRVSARPTLPPRPKSVGSVRLVTFSRKSVCKCVSLKLKMTILYSLNFRKCCKADHREL